LTIVDSFDVPAAKDVLWNTFQDVTRVVKHVPGAVLLSGSGDGPYEGEIGVAFGPRIVRFRGTLTYVRDATAHRGVINGSGKDARGNSRATVRSAFELTDADASGKSTRVNVVADVDFAGPLAEFGYTGGTHVTRALIKDFARSLADEYGTSEDRMQANAQPTLDSRPPVSGIWLALVVFWAWFKALLSYWSQTYS
jgi:carbon monoxide dehydrogenase subunit G